MIKTIMRDFKTVLRCFCWKEHGDIYGTVGSNIIAYMNGHFFGFTVEAEVSKPTKHQKAIIHLPTRSLPNNIPIYHKKSHLQKGVLFCKSLAGII